MSFLELLQNVERNLQESGKRRFFLWKDNEALKEATKDSSFLETHGSTLATLIVDSSGWITDSYSRSAVEGILQGALNSESFLKTFAGTLVRHGGQISGKRESFYLLKWTCWILKTLKFPESQKPISKLLSIAGKCLDCLKNSSSNDFKRASKTLKPILAADIEFCKEALSIGSISLIQVICSLVAQSDGKLNELRGPLLDKYINTVLGAKTEPKEDMLEAYQALLASMNRAEFADTVLPAVLRCLRRNPDVVFEVAKYLFKVVNVDLSAFQDDLQKVLVQFIRQNNLSFQSSAVELQSLIARQISDRDILQKSVEVFHDVLTGKSEGKIKNIQERVHLTRALGSLAASPSKRKDFSSQVIESLSQLYKNEGNEEVKVETLSVIGIWLKTCSSFPKSGLEVLNEALTGKDNLKTEALKALTGCYRNTELFINGTSLIPSLSKVVETGINKTTHRAEGISAFLILVLISSVDPQSDSVMENSGIWKLVLSTSCPFYDSTVIAKLNESSCEVLVNLCQTLLLLHVSRVDNSPGLLDCLCEVLILLSVHKAKTVRTTAHGSISRCLGSSSSLLFNFLEAFGHWQKNSTRTQEISGGEGESFPSMEETKNLFLKSLKNLVSLGIDSQSKVLSALLLRAHHPLLQSSKDPQKLWNSLLKQSTDILPTLKHSIEEVVGVLLGERGLESEDENERKAALAGITTTATSFPVLLFQKIFDFSENIIQTSEAELLTETDIKIWKTPAGHLSTESVNTVVIIPDDKKKQTKKKPKGRFRHEKVAFAERSESSEEEEEVEIANQKAQQKGKKSGNLDAAERQMKFREKQLQEESALRERVNKTRRKLTVGLEALTAFIRGNKSFAAEHLEELGSLILPLLTSQLVGEDSAFKAVQALASTLPPPLNLIPLDIAVVLRFVYLYQQDGSISLEEILSHGATLAVMHGIAAAQLQGGPAFVLLLPILKIVLQSIQSPYFDSALKVLTSNCAYGDQLPRSEVASLLFEALLSNPATKSLIQDSLKQLCKFIVGEEIFSILNGLLFSNPVVREVALKAIEKIPDLKVSSPTQLASYLLLSAHDVVEENAQLAQQLFAANHCELSAELLSFLTPFLGHELVDIRQAANGAVVQCLQEFPFLIESLLEEILQTVGIRKTKSWLLGSALLIKNCGKMLDSGQAKRVLVFLLSTGLCDKDDEVRGKMVDGGLAVVDGYDPSDIDSLFQLIDQHLMEAKGENRDHEADDRMREGAVVLLGSMAQHLSSEDEKIKNIIENLLEVLSTPSETVQRAASTCLSPLIQKRQADGEYISLLIKGLKKQVSTGGSYGVRRGAAYGIAGVVKGLGISSLRNYSIMDALMEFVGDKGNALAREGGISVFDCLSQRLGKLFEPYVIQILPLMLTCFGDSSVAVRQATAEASRTIMHNLSGHGVKLVLPNLMKGLEDKAWRTKQGSIQLLGSMAWCAPKQLSSCLPMIVPKLILVLADPHPKVHSAAEQALEEVGTTIRNPEIQQLVPDLLSAIAQPTKNNVHCLDKLLESNFVHTIDAPSLALIVPVVHRGLKDRAGENKKRASRIVQNLCKLVNDPKDMDPYMDLLLPELKRAIVDPLPDVRAQSSKALSSLMYDMGKKALEEVMPWLMETLESKNSSVERSGAAQALSEVLAVFGENYFETLLPKILENCASTNAVLREGGISVLRFLPYSMSEIFQKKLTTVLPHILDGLADENEAVRDVSLSAGKTLVDIYAQSSLPLILPAVEQSLFHENWRIRQSSVELLGKLFFKVAGTSGKVKLDGGSDEEGPATQSYGHSLIKALGFETRNGVLAKLYMSRSDIQHPVRTSALHIWKTVVVNTPKTLMEILSAVMDLIIEMLAAGGEDGRQTAGQCLGELVKKMGDRVLPQIIPILEQGFQSEVVQTREGVCYGMRELLDSLTSAQLASYLPVLLPTIQGSLCDPDKSVREISAVAFDALFKAGASSVVDSVVPDLLHKLDQEKEKEQALEGLRVILSIRPHTLANVLPKLLREPLGVSRIQALASLAEVAAGSLRANLPTILRVLLKHGSNPEEDELTLAARDGAVKVALAIPEENLHLIVAELRKGMDDLSERYCSALVISSLASSRTLTDHLSILLQTVVSFMSEDDFRILEQCWKALSAVAKAVPKDLQSSFIRVLKEAVDTAKEKQRRKDPLAEEIIVPGFTLPRALDPILPFYLSGINQGTSAELRELAAEGLGELVTVIDSVSLKPFVFQIIGPLIRISGERFPWQIKLAILKTMGLLISKAGEDVKKFVSALQPIFMKCLQDPTSAIRDSAAKNLGQLSLVNQRIDQLITNLISSAFKMESPFRNAYLTALTEAFVISGERISTEVLNKTGPILEDLMKPVFEDEDDVIPLAKCLGAFFKFAELSFLTEFLTNQFSSSSVVWTERQFTAVLMASIAKNCLDRLQESDLMDSFVQTMNTFVRDDKIPIKKATCRCASRLIQSKHPDSITASIPILVACLGPDQTTEIHEEALKSIQVISHGDCELLKPHLNSLVPLICALAKESSGTMKLHCETTLTLLLDLDDGFINVREFLAGSPGATAKSLLAEPYLRRIQKLNKLSDFEQEEF